ncbi:hypothetical protein BCV69DRAFT_162584 [Microstroma glucosiphilum]|uniref:Uncharacterized protein n=1 Tax=Pseudomicrostroma glucosiphilum TaxID=1684307 RepID=A0A316UC96_9BASI|nr:hypothetical protein BCV69DRAFT_162584 [Pseudomicrostroma glucosiphilum]PWN22023.1 hypothetical protein BCV69DRAFT_162584 [Pseudomicrostroma glucosiphilum]
MSTSYSLDDLQDLQTQPIFLSQFLKLSLPRIRTLYNPSTARLTGPTRQPSFTNRAYFGSTTAVATSDSPPSPTLLKALPELQLSEWPSFLESIHTSLSTIQGGEHILAPPAFRADDLPIATLLPTVFLWVIVAVWQPCLRMYELDEFHIAIGAGQGGEGERRRELKAGDHLPEHEELEWAQQVGEETVGALPRQVFYTIKPTTTRDRMDPPGKEEDEAFRGIKALISVEEPWTVDLSLLDPTSISSEEILSCLKESGQGKLKNQEGADLKRATTFAALLTCLSSLQESKVRFAVLTTYELFVFVKVGFSGDGVIDMVEMSPPVKSGDTLKQGKSTSVFAAMWWFGKEIMTG